MTAVELTPIESIIALAQSGYRPWTESPHPWTLDQMARTIGRELHRAAVADGWGRQRDRRTTITHTRPLLESRALTNRRTPTPTRSKHGSR